MPGQIFSTLYQAYDGIVTMFLKFFLQITKINFSYTNFTWIVNKHLFWIFSRFVFGTTVKVVAVTAHLFTTFRCSITDKSVIAIPLFSVVTLFWFFFLIFLLYRFVMVTLSLPRWLDYTINTCKIFLFSESLHLFACFSPVTPSDPP